MSYQPELTSCVDSSRVICEPVVPVVIENISMDEIISMRFKMSEEEWINWSKENENGLELSGEQIEQIEQMEKQQKNTEREKERKYDQQEYDLDMESLDVVRNTFVSLCETLDKDELLSQIQKVQALIQSCVWGIGICEYGMTNQWKLVQLQDALQKTYNVTNSVFSFRDDTDYEDKLGYEDC